MILRFCVLTAFDCGVWAVVSIGCVIRFLVGLYNTRNCCFVCLVIVLHCSCLCWIYVVFLFRLRVCGLRSFVVFCVLTCFVAFVVFCAVLRVLWVLVNLDVP